MLSRILVVTATEREAALLEKVPGWRRHSGGFTSGQTHIQVLITGVGTISTAWSIQKWLINSGTPDLALNIGIAGSFRDNIGIGDVVMPVTDCYGDSGIEDGSQFFTLFEAGLAGKDEFPFEDGVIKMEDKLFEKLGKTLRPVHGVTVSKATGSEATREDLIRKFNPDIETMEGATFFYICKRENIPFLALRAISNRVGKRERDKWDIPLALNSLAGKVEEISLKLI